MTALGCHLVINLICQLLGSNQRGARVSTRCVEVLMKFGLSGKRLLPSKLERKQRAAHPSLSQPPPAGLSPPSVRPGHHDADLQENIPFRFSSYHLMLVSPYYDAPITP